jgi:hypothetical protein
MLVEDDCVARAARLVADDADHVLFVKERSADVIYMDVRLQVFPFFLRTPSQNYPLLLELPRIVR